MMADVSGRPAGFGQVRGAHSGQQLHVSGVFIIVLEVALVLENLLPILVVVLWLPSRSRGVSDRLVAAFSVTCILSALVPTPLGLASYFSGGWYGGSPTCTTYQVTSIWCNLSSLALLAYMCLNCHFAVYHLRKSSASHRCRGNETQALPKLDGSSSYLSSSPENTAASEMTGSGTENSVMGSIRSMSLDAEKGGTLKKGESDSQRESASYAYGESRSQNQSGSFKNQMLSKSATNSGMNSPSKDDKDCGSTRSVHFVDEAFRDHDGSIKQTSGCSVEQFASEPADSNSGDKNDTSSGNNLYKKSARGKSPSSSICDINYVQLEALATNAADANTTSVDCVRAGTCRSSDYVSLVLFFLYTITLAISSLPVVGYGPPPPAKPINEKSCRSWLVPTPTPSKESTFFVAYLVFVYACLVTGCGSGVSVCLQVSRRLRQERKRRSRLYHEEEDVPDIQELSTLESLKRHYSLNCLVMAGLLTWLPISVMLTLQKAGVQVSEATLMYSNIATSLPGLLNPLLYSLFLARYRAGYKAVLEKCCCGKRKKKVRGLRVCGQRDPSDTGDNPVTTMTSSFEGHQCSHGRTNPRFTVHSDIQDYMTSSGFEDTEIGEEDEDDDDEDEDDEDYYHEDCDLMEEIPKQPTPKVDEKTPLQSMAMAATLSLSSSGRSFKTVLAKGDGKRNHHWHRNVDSSRIGDKECLLASSPSACVILADDETGL